MKSRFHAAPLSTQGLVGGIAKSVDIVGLCNGVFETDIKRVFTPPPP
ncbi:MULTISPECIES: hypothetical protein [Helicobacter]|nr:MULTISPECIES: hypothetical protein [Helicobacter]